VCSETPSLVVGRNLMTERERKRRKLPKHCECGGRMLYDAQFDRVFSACDTCTPVLEDEVPK